MASESEITNEYHDSIIEKAIDWRSRSEFFKEKLHYSRLLVKKLEQEKSQLIFKLNNSISLPINITSIDNKKGVGIYCEVCPNELTKTEVKNKFCNRCKSHQ